MTAPVELEARFPKKLAFLLTEQWRYKIVYGGRGSAKSRSISGALVLKGAQRPERWLCARETQKSLEFSSRQILVDQINRMGLQGSYEVLANQIRGRHIWPDGRRTVFVFEGIKEASADALKSMEDFDGCWIAEAHAVTKASWNKLTPTFRREDSEIWVDFNPELEDDFIWKFAQNPPPNAKVVSINYDENPWFPEALRVDMEHMRSTEPEEYRHVWLGKPRSAASGAIFAAEMGAADAEGRICSVPYDRTKPVFTVWDLGFDDFTAVWFVQAYGGYLNFIDYLEGNGQAIHSYITDIQRRGYVLGTVWLPFDSANNVTHKRLVGASDLSLSIPTLMQEAGLKVQLTPALLVRDSLNAARTAFPLCRFDKDKCADGIRHLRYYAWDRQPDERGQRKPEHNEHSHSADAFRYATLVVKPGDSLAKPKPVAPPPPRPSVPKGRWT